MKKQNFIFIFILCLLFISFKPAYAEKGKVLIVVSSAEKITLKNKKVKNSGLFLNQLAMVTDLLKKRDFSYTLVSPLGKNLKIDPISDNPKLFNNKKEYDYYKNFFNKNLKNKKTMPIKSILSVIDDYSGLIILGGFTSLEDLPTNKDLGFITSYFYGNKKIVGALAEGVMGLVSTMRNPDNFMKYALINNYQFAMNYASDWSFRKHKITVITKDELKAILKDDYKYEPFKVLSYGQVFFVTSMYGEQNVVIDENLITAQNNRSIEPFIKRFVNNLHKK